MNDSMVPDLERCRRAEKEQALFYRRLAADAEAQNDGSLAQRFHDLHADEQHHLSRLTARIIELGHNPQDLADVRPPNAMLADWEESARARETREIDQYVELLTSSLDPQTQRLIQEIVDVERSHASELGGKWTMA